VLVKAIRENVWVINSAEPMQGLYESREAAIRAIDLTPSEKLTLLDDPAVPLSEERVISYAEVAKLLARRRAGEQRTADSASSSAPLSPAAV
jgi:hypothetical protein